MNKIKFVRYYNNHNNNIWEIVYKSGRVKTVLNDRLPRTAEHFCILAKTKTEQADKFHGLETIWAND